MIIPVHWLIKYYDGTYSTVVYFDEKSALELVESTVVFVPSIEKEIVDE